MNEEDTSLLRFLWWPDEDTSKRLEQSRMTVDLFGAISSPGCANFALQKSAEDNKDKFDALTVNTIISNFYVNDCLISVGTEEQAIDLVKDLSALCVKGGFKLTKWVSNNRAVLATTPDEDKAKQIKELDLDREKLPVERALGMYWITENDSFGFQIIIKTRALT